MRVPLTKHHLVRLRKVFSNTKILEVLWKLNQNFSVVRSDEQVFYELCFCLCSPQVKFSTNRITNQLLQEAQFYSEDISNTRLSSGPLKGMRFRAVKSARLNKAKAGFEPILRLIRLRIDPTLARKWLVKNVEGLGMKTASHFLRNGGRVKELAIVDTHILKFLKIEGGVKDHHHYSKIEGEFRKIADNLGVSMFDLDAVVWSWYSGIPLREVR